MPSATHGIREGIAQCRIDLERIEVEEEQRGPRVDVDAVEGAHRLDRPKVGGCPRWTNASAALRRALMSSKLLQLDAAHDRLAARASDSRGRCPCSTWRAAQTACRGRRSAWRPSRCPRCRSRPFRPGRPRPCACRSSEAHRARMSPNGADRLPLYVEPCACAHTPMTVSSCSSAIARIASMSHT